MAVQRPFYASGSATQIKQYPDNEFSNMLGRIGYLYANDPVTTLSVTTANGNAGPVLTDTRYRSGPFGQSTGDQDAFDDGLLEYDQSPGEPELLTAATFDRLDRSINPPTSLVNFDSTYYTSQVTKPVKWDPSTNSFVEMTYLECVDAFIDQWYQGQTNPSVSNPASGGAYFVSSNVSEAGATLQSTTPVFVDTVADASAYQASLIGGAGVTYQTNNFNAATGSSSTTLYSSLIGGSGIQINFSNVAASDTHNYGFGDFVYGNGVNAARPTGTLLAYMSSKINHNGNDGFVMSQDMYNTYIQYKTSTGRFNTRDYLESQQYKVYPRVRAINDYPLVGDKHVVDYGFQAMFAADHLISYNNGWWAPGSSENYNYGSRVEYDVSGADYLFMWANGDRGADDPGYINMFLKGTNGNIEGVFLNADQNFGNSFNGYAPWKVNWIDRLGDAGLINTSGGYFGSQNKYSDPNNAGVAVRLHLDGKVEKFVVHAGSPGRPSHTGFAFTKNTTSIATNSTGFDIQTPVGTTRTAGSSWSLPLNSSGQWSLAAGTWQTSTVVGASAQQSTVTFNSVSGNGTTANAALASLGGGIDVSVTSLAGVTEEQIPPMTALDANQMFGYSTASSTGLTKIFNGTYLINRQINDIDAAERSANQSTYGSNYRCVESYTIQQGDVGSALMFVTTSSASVASHPIYTQVLSGPFVFEQLTGSGLPGGTFLYSRNTLRADSNSNTGKRFGWHRGISDPFGYDANGFRFYSIRQQDVGQTITIASYGTLLSATPDPQVNDAYLQLLKITDTTVATRYTATATNNTGYAIQTPVGTTRPTGSSWQLTNNVSTNAWTIAAGQYYQTTGTDTYQDHFITTNYYLHKMDLQMQTLGTGYKTPLVVDYDGNGDARGLRSMTYQEFDNFFEPLVKYVSSNLQGYRLNYNIDGNGYTIGNPILNKQMVGVTGRYVTRFVNVNDYRSQEFPNGVIVAQNTHRLKLEKY